MEARQVFRTYKAEAAGAEAAEAAFRFCPACGAGLPPAASGASGRQRCAACGFVRYRNPLPGVSVVVVDRGRVLLCKRSPGSFRPHLWCLPGGFIEHDEDFLTAGIREAAEETGVRVRVESIISVVTNRLAPGLHTLVVVLLARVAGGALAPGDDAVELQWVSPAGPLPEMAFEADRHIIQRFAAGVTGAPVDPRFAGPDPGPTTGAPGEPRP